MPLAAGSESRYSLIIQFLCNSPNGSLKDGYAELIESLEENPEQGTPLGNDCYKIRLSIASKGKGKSGGARVITNVAIVQKTVYLLSIYDKSEQSDITDKELKELLKQIS